MQTGFQPDANRVCRTISVRQTLPFYHTLSFYLYILIYSPCASISSSHIALISSIFSFAAVWGSSMAITLLFHHPFSTSIGSLSFNYSFLSQIFYYFLDLFSCEIEFFHKPNLCYRRLFFHSLQNIPFFFGSFFHLLFLAPFWLFFVHVPSFPLSKMLHAQIILR